MSRGRTLVVTELLLGLGLLAFIGAAWAAERLLGLRDPVHLGAAWSIALSAVPALLWLGYFYLQDRNEPEPKHYVAGVYLLGAFVAAPLASFLTTHVFPVASPASPRLTGGNVVAAVLSAGLAQELCKLLVVRYTVYLSREFDEPMDGIVYMTAAGIGFATAENAALLGGAGGNVYLTTGAMNTVVSTLAHACFAGFLGYALGRARFSRASALQRNLMLLAGLVMAATLNGLFRLLASLVRVDGMGIAAWKGVVFAAGFAAVVFAGVSVLMRQHLRVSPHRRAP